MLTSEERKKPQLLPRLSGEISGIVSMSVRRPVISVQYMLIVPLTLNILKNKLIILKSTFLSRVNLEHYVCICYVYIMK